MNDVSPIWWAWLLALVGIAVAWFFGWNEPAEAPPASVDPAWADPGIHEAPPARDAWDA